VSRVSCLAFVRVNGADAAVFLNGQYSQSTLAMAAGESRIGAFCTPKGRALAVACVIATDAGFELWTHRTIIESLVTTLKRYVMRADVQFEAPAQTVSSRLIHLAAIATDLDLASPDFAAAAVAAGVPTLNAATSGEFVPQMINLDLVGGIDFTKGCYTGQEIVARTHNLGSIKRRMLAYACADAAAQAAGDPLLDADGERVGQVVATAGNTVLAVVRLARRRDARKAGASAIDGLQTLPYDIPELTANA